VSTGARLHGLGLPASKAGVAETMSSGSLVHAARCLLRSKQQALAIRSAGSQAGLITVCVRNDSVISGRSGVPHGVETTAEAKLPACLL
jgi:hypothetical protein